MPLITPKKSEKQGEFVSRCMGDETMNKEFPNQKQRAAVCYSQWGDKKAKASVVLGEGENEMLFEFKKNKALAESLEEYKKDFYEMSVGSLNSIKKHAENILQSLENPTVKENLTESWLQGKIAITEDYMLTIHNYVMFVEESEENETENS
jgi:hypothetical protein